MRLIPDAILTTLLTPVLIPQALATRRRAMRLPEPAGARSGTVGDGPALRLLVLGDSTAAGVGADDLSETLAPQIAGRLERQVNWQICARSGATSADAPGLLAPVQEQSYDVAFVVFGVNDTKNMRSEAEWRRDVTTLIQDLHRRCGVVMFSGLPDMGRFPLLPNPLRWIMGLRAARFDQALAEMCTANGAIHLPLDIPLIPHEMCRDGFHPGPKAYARWADLAAARIKLLNI